MVLPQLTSSVLSGQSNDPSHTLYIGIIFPSPQRKSVPCSKEPNSKSDDVIKCYHRNNALQEAELQNTSSFSTL